MKKVLTLAACCLGLAPGPSFAENSDQLADIGLERRIAVLASAAETHAFEIGMLQSLRAVEQTLQTRYEYGLGDRLVDLPILRLQFGGMSHPQPKTAQPDTLSKIVSTFVTDLRQAQNSLTSVDIADVQAFELTLQDLWFDIDNNGQRAAEESAASILAPVLLGQRAMQDPDTAALLETPITIRFDAADHDWLLAYTHLLSGFGNAFLAFDPTPVIRDLSHQQAVLAAAPSIEYTFDVAAISDQIVELTALLDQIGADIKPLSDIRKSLDSQLNEIRAQITAAPTESEKAALRLTEQKLSADRSAKFNAIRELQANRRRLRAEIRSTEAKLPGDHSPRRNNFVNQTTLDTAYLVIASLRQQPNPDHIHAARQDWQAMIEYNIGFWTKLALETDNDREWIPNPDQTSALPLTLPPGTADAWQRILTDAQSVLGGKLLIQHPFLPDGYGINAAAYFEDPSPLNLLDWLHGVGAYKYAARGPVLTQQGWRAFNRLTRGNAGGFALFLN